MPSEMVRDPMAISSCCLSEMCSCQLLCISVGLIKGMSFYFFVLVFLKCNLLFYHMLNLIATAIENNKLLIFGGLTFSLFGCCLLPFLSTFLLFHAGLSTR